jgi:stress response protein YsnF
LIGALTDMGIPEDEAKHYQDQVGGGKTLVVVRANDDVSAERAADILESSGAENVAGRDFGGEPTSDVDELRKRQTLRDAEPDATDWARDTNVQAERTYSSEQIPAAETKADERITPQDTRTIPVTEEQLVVGKRAVEGSRVRIYGRETEKPVEDSVQLRSEHVTIERRSVDRPVAETDRSKEAVIEITEMKEEPVVGKQERVVEEIVIGKTAEEHTETVRDTVRRKDVEVERTDDERISREDRRN